MATDGYVHRLIRGFDTAGCQHCNTDSEFLCLWCRAVICPNCVDESCSYRGFDRPKPNPIADQPAPPPPHYQLELSL